MSKRTESCAAYPVVSLRDGHINGYGDRRWINRARYAELTELSARLLRAEGLYSMREYYWLGPAAYMKRRYL